MAARQIEKYGWKRDLPDHRDYIYGAQEEIHLEAVLPARVDISEEMPPIYDQGQLGSCVANGVNGTLEHQQTQQGEPAVTPSRLFTYYEGRRLEGDPLSQDTGLEVRTGLKVVITEGAPPETDWPYDISRFAERPPAKAYADALKHEALAYKRIILGRGAPLRSALFHHLPVVFGFSVPDTFEDPNWDPVTQYLPLPGRDNSIIGGHCVVKVGYDWTCTRFPVPVWKVRNSWGANWGDDGHFYMQWDWDDPKRNLASDFWVISKTT